MLFLSLVCAPAACYGLRASAEKQCQVWYPEKQPADRAEMIRVPTRVGVRALCVLVWAYAMVLRLLGRGSLTLEFVYVGASAAIEVLFAWEDAGCKPQLERLGVAVFVFASGVYVWNDDVSLRFALVYVTISMLWMLLGDAVELLDLKLHPRARPALRVCETCVLGGMLCKSAYDAGSVDPMMIFLNALTVRGCETSWFLS